MYGITANPGNAEYMAILTKVRKLVFKEYILTVAARVGEYILTVAARVGEYVLTVAARAEIVVPSSMTPLNTPAIINDFIDLTPL